MRNRDLCRRRLALTLLGAVGLGVAFSLVAVTGLSGSHRAPGDLERSTGDQAAQPEVKVCSPKEAREAGPAGDLELTATKDGVLKFQCGENLELKPAEPTTKVYQYTVTQETTKSCDSQKEVLLTTALEGATVTEDTTEAARAQSPSKSKVYVFKYTTEPTDEKHLCYTCVTTPAAAPGVAGRDVQQEGTPAGAAKCTVFIKVPKKAGETSNSLPGARALPAAIATAVGGFLAVVLRM